MSRVQKGTGSEAVPHQDPLGLDDEVEINPAVLPVPQPTGLSEEEDALRHMAQRFNPTLVYCPNCEVIYDDETSRFDEIEAFCPRCAHRLWPVGTQPLSSKRKHT